MKQAIVLGGGLSGLSACYYLQKKYPEIKLTLIEKSNRLGGLIETHMQGPFLFEMGPHSMRFSENGAQGLELIEELGIEKDLLEAKDVSKQRYLYMGERMQKLPSSFKEALLSPFFWKALPGILNEWRVPPSELSDVSVYTFVKRRFGKTIAETFFDPLISGIYAGSCHEISVKSAFPQLVELERKHGSVIKGLFKKKSQKNGQKKYGIFSFSRGLQVLTDTLASKLNVDIHLSNPVLSLSFNGQNVTVTTEKGEFIADYVVSSLSAKDLAKILPPKETQFKHSLEKMRYAPLAIVNLGYCEEKTGLKGFGHLIPSSEREKVLGVIWDSSIFPEQNPVSQTRLAVMIGGSRMGDFATYSEEDFTDMALDAVKRQLRIEEKPDRVHVKIYKDVIPQYFVGHGEWRSSIEEMLKKLTPRMFLAGNSFYGVSINDCVARAKTLSLPI